MFRAPAFRVVSTLGAMVVLWAAVLMAADVRITRWCGRQGLRKLCRGGGVSGDVRRPSRAACRSH